MFVPLSTFGENSHTTVVLYNFNGVCPVELMATFGKGMLVVSVSRSFLCLELPTHIGVKLYIPLTSFR